VVLQVFTHAGQINHAFDTVLLELLFRPETRTHQNCRATVRASRYNHFLLSLILNSLTRFRYDSDACCTQLARLLGHENLVNSDLSLDGDIIPAMGIGDEISSRGADSLVDGTRHVTASMWCLAGREHVCMVGQAVVNHAFLDAFRDRG
jgi:hypothetical protein